MSPLIARPIAVAGLLVLASTTHLGLGRPWLTMGAGLFGVANLALVITGSVPLARGVLAGSLIGLAFWPSGLRDFGTAGSLPALWVWPVAWFFVLVATRESAGEGASEAREAGHRARVTTAAIITAIGCGALLFRATQAGGVEQTAALFVGVPTVLAIVTVLFTGPRTAVGVAVKAVTVGLLVSLTLLNEGFLCVLMSAPLFYLLAIIVAKAAAEARSEANASERRIVSGLIGLACIPMSLEGVTPGTSFNRHEAVTVTRIVAAPSDLVARALLTTPRFDRGRPALLRIGFPWPEAASVEHGTAWTVTMRGGEMRLTGMEPRTGTLRLELVEAAPGSVRWQAAADDSHMRHFLTWQGSDVRYEAVDPAHTRVSWTLRYRRDLDPAWYFGPMERYAATAAADYLITAVATP